MSDKVLYYRGRELVTEKQVKRMKKLWGLTPYNHFKSFTMDNNSNTGIFDITELLFTIWNDSYLNDRNNALIERINKNLPKGLTPSSGYYSISVEHNLLHKLMLDAIEQFNRESERQIESYQVPFIELERLYKLPLTNSVIDEMDKYEKKIGSIPRPTKFNKVKFSLCQDQCSTFKEYIVKGELSHYLVNKEKYNKLYKVFPYLAKLHGRSFTKDAFQLYVYDYKRKNWAMQNVINYLLENKMLVLY